MRHFLFILILIGAIAAGRWIYLQTLAILLIGWADDARSRELALEYAPNNPAVIAARAKYLAFRAEVPDTGQGLAELRRAVSLTPSDYRYWLELGRVAETHGDLSTAAQAIDRARSLAPRHFETHWAWANFRLRNGETEDAIAAFHQALLISENRPGVTNGRAALNVYDALTQSRGLDLRILKQVAPDDEIAQSWLAWYLAGRGQLDPAMEVFRRLPRQVNPATPELASQMLLTAQQSGRYAEAYEIWARLRSASLLPESLPGELIENGGFEEPDLADRFATLRDTGLGFGWVVARHPEVVATRDDDRPYRGGKSMRVSFPRGMTVAYSGLSQLIRVEPGLSYRLMLHCRTRNLPPETPWLEVTGRSSTPGIEAEIKTRPRIELPREAPEWQPIEIDFVVPPGVSAIHLTLQSPRYWVIDGFRRPELWIDEVTLTRGKG